MGNLVLQVQAQYVDQIKALTASINKMETSIFDKKALIDSIDVQIKAKSDAIAREQAARQGYANELSRLQAVRNQNKRDVEGGCNQRIGYDNACLDANTAAQNAAAAAIRACDVKISQLSTELNALKTQRLQLVDDRDKENVAMQKAMQDLAQLNTAYNNAMTEAQAAESAAAIAQSTAQNMGTATANQASVIQAQATADAKAAADRLAADIRLNEQKLQAEKDAAELEAKKDESSNRTWIILGVVGGLVVLTAIVIIVVFRNR